MKITNLFILTAVFMGNVSNVRGMNAEPVQVVFDALYTMPVREDGYTGFECETEEVVTQALARIPEKAGVSDVIMIKVEVLLSDFLLLKKHGFESIWNENIFYNFRRGKQCTPVKPMVKACGILYERGYKLIFDTGRRSWEEGLRDATLEQLNDVLKEVETEVGTDELFLAPDECNWQHYKEKTVSFGRWMGVLRQAIANDGEKIIVATFGDCDDDFEGGSTGIEVRLPNYLQLYAVAPK